LKKDDTYIIPQTRRLNMKKEDIKQKIEYMAAMVEDGENYGC
jgi:hypothetical protein